LVGHDSINCPNVHHQPSTTSALGKRQQKAAHQ